MSYHVPEKHTNIVLASLLLYSLVSISSPVGIVHGGDFRNVPPGSGIKSTAHDFSRSRFHVVHDVIGGETLIVETGDRKEEVRLLGVRVPAEVPGKPAGLLQQEAKEFTRDLAGGKKIRLEYDARERDETGKLLAYVYLDDGRLLNAEIIRNGYGSVDAEYPFQYLGEFRQCEREAKGERRGFWK